MTTRRGVIVAGIDVGNHTTELVLSCVHDGTVTPQAHGHAPTRGRKGSLESLQGAAALLHRLEVDTHADLPPDGSAPSQHDEHQQSQSLRGFETELGFDQHSQSQRNDGPAWVY